MNAPHSRPGLAWLCRFLRGLLGSVSLLALASGCGRPPVSHRSGEQAAPYFHEEAQAAGLRYRWEIPGSRPLNILQTIGHGCAFLDYDGDGNLDILLVGPHLALYRGDGRGHFEDVTQATGLDRLTGDFLGCAVGDYDNDGYPDIYVSAYRGGLLLHNEPAAAPGHVGLASAHRFFRDVTRQAGITPQPWGTSCGWVESLPGSGRLDLYICNYAVFGPGVVPQLCRENGVLTSCGPRSYTPLRGVFYKNDGHGHFHDATREAGLSTALGRALGVAFADYNGSGYASLAIANDEMPGDLMEGRPGSSVRFQNRRELSGVAYDLNGNVHGGMGIDWGDYDNDGRLDLLVATFQNENKSLYHNEGQGEFTDMSVRTGLGGATARYVAFGCKFLDYDNDGWLDIVIANGHVQDNIQAVDSSASYRQPCQLFHNTGSRPPRFQEVTAQASPDMLRPIVGRGLAVGDYNNDGKVDLLVVDAEGAPLLLRNQAAGAGHWLGARLIGTTCNRDGYGAVVRVQVGGRELVRQCQSGGSYLSASDSRVHFGLGAAQSVDTLTVHWPGGHVTTLHSVRADRYITVREEGARP